MSSWRECKLGEVAKFSQGIQVPLEEQQTEIFENCVRFIRIVDFTKGDENEIRYIKNPGERYLVNSDDLVMIRYGSQTAGKIAKGFNGAIANNTFKITPEETILNKNFLYYFLSQKSIFDFFHYSQASSTMPAITFGMIGNLDLEIPPLEEQKAIAEVLSSLDDKIDLLHRQNQTLESLAQTLFRQWFIEEAKEEWGKKPLGKITNIAIGRTPPRKEEEWFSTDSKDVKWISIKDLGNDGAFIFKTSEYLTQEAVERFNVPVIPKDTVVLSFKMTVGRVAITTESMLSNEAIAHFKFNDKTPISKEYLYLFLKTFPYESLGSTSSIVTAINSAMIKEMMILIPDEETMKKFSSIVEPQFEKIRQNQQQIKTLENFRDTLLPKLLSGEVRVER